MRKTLIAAAAVLLTTAGACLARPPGITHEMIERALPVEGVPLAAPGPYKVTSGPVLLINGGEPDFMMATSAATFDLMNRLPAFYGARHNAGHTATVFHPGGGEFANVASNWLLWTFKGDKKRGAMFVGKDCSLCTNSNWDVRSQGIKQ